MLPFFGVVLKKYLKIAHCVDFSADFNDIVCGHSFADERHCNQKLFTVSSPNARYTKLKNFSPGRFHAKSVCTSSYIQGGKS